jgi:signal transduction histidine kinase
MNIIDSLRVLFNPGSFEPHRLHFTETPELMWFIVIGNAFVALAYFLIPFALVYFIRKREDLVFHWVFIFFAAFIFFCALTHIMHIVTFWYPVYWLQGVIDGATGVVSMATALALIPVIPQALKLPSPEQMRRINTNLKDEIIKKEKAEKEVKKLNRSLEKRVRERTRELEDAYEELQESEKRKDEFISMASHELKTPITSMNGYVYALEKKILSSKDQQAGLYLNKVKNQINKQTKLVADLLDVTRLQTNKLHMDIKPFDMNAVVDQVSEDMQTVALKHNIVVKGKLKQNVMGDSERIAQVLNNFLSNAIKFSPNATKIIVSLREDATHAIVSVQDFGMGIEKEQQKKIFIRFYRVYGEHENTFPGLGVGLYIAEQIIEQHNGKIWVESAKDKGSIFSFSIPLVQKKKH